MKMIKAQVARRCLYQASPGSSQFPIGRAQDNVASSAECSPRPQRIIEYSESIWTTEEADHKEVFQDYNTEHAVLQTRLRLHRDQLAKIRPSQEAKTAFSYVLFIYFIFPTK